MPVVEAILGLKFFLELLRYLKRAFPGLVHFVHTKREAAKLIKEYTPEPVEENKVSSSNNRESRIIK